MGIGEWLEELARADPDKAPEQPRPYFPRPSELPRPSEPLEPALYDLSEDGQVSQDIGWQVNADGTVSRETGSTPTTLLWDDKFTSASSLGNYQGETDMFEIASGELRPSAANSKPSVEPQLWYAGVQRTDMVIIAGITVQHTSQFAVLITTGRPGGAQSDIEMYTNYAYSGGANAAVYFHDPTGAGVTSSNLWSDFPEQGTKRWHLLRIRGSLGSWFVFGEDPRVNPGIQPLYAAVDFSLEKPPRIDASPRRMPGLMIQGGGESGVAVNEFAVYTP